MYYQESIVGFQCGACFCVSQARGQVPSKGQKMDGATKLVAIHKCTHVMENIFKNFKRYWFKHMNKNTINIIFNPGRLWEGSFPLTIADNKWQIQFLYMVFNRQIYKTIS